MDFSTGRMKLAAGIAVLSGAAVVTTLAQGLGPSSAGSLAELTAEVRQMRGALQEASRSQNQMQALTDQARDLAQHAGQAANPQKNG